jgi:SnoaL-like domain
MSSADAHLKKFFAAWLKADAAIVAACYAPDCIMDDPTLDLPIRGNAAVEAYYREMFSALEAPVHELVDFASRDNHIWFQWTFGSGGIGKPKVEHQGVSIHTLRPDGLIAVDRAFWQPLRSDGSGK